MISCITSKPRRWGEHLRDLKEAEFAGPPSHPAMYQFPLGLLSGRGWQLDIFAYCSFCHKTCLSPRSKGPTHDHLSVGGHASCQGFPCVGTIKVWPDWGGELEGGADVDFTTSTNADCKQWSLTQFWQKHPCPPSAAYIFSPNPWIPVLLGKLVTEYFDRLSMTCGTAQPWLRSMPWTFFGELFMASERLELGEIHSACYQERPEVQRSAFPLQ